LDLFKIHISLTSITKNNIKVIVWVKNLVVIITITGSKKASSINNNELALFYLDISRHTRVIM